MDAADSLIQAQEAYRPSMAQVIDLPGALAYARKRLPSQRFTMPPQPLPEGGAIPLDAVANPDFTIVNLEDAIFPPP